MDIHSDNGGMVNRYYERFQKAPKPIRIFGKCVSACTLALAYPTTCVGPNASLVFHAPSHWVAKRFLFNQYPPAVRSWIKSKGGLTPKYITLKGAELHRIVRGCGA